MKAGESMALTVYNAMKLNTLRNFRLMAGQLGLERRITKTGILDYEFTGDMPPDVENQFDVGEFVLSSMLYAKESEDALMKAVQRLIQLRVAALAIKTIFFKELPENVRQLADREQFPIFLFDNTVFFEDVITEISESIKSTDQLFLLEQKLDTLIHKDLSAPEIRAAAHELNRDFKERIMVFYCEAPIGAPPVDAERICSSCQKNRYRNTGSLVLRYKQGVMVMISDPSSDEQIYHSRFADLMAYIGQSPESFFVGGSNCCSTADGLAQALKEAVWALQIGVLEQKAYSMFAEAGIYRLLIPHQDSIWLDRYMESTMGQLEKQDVESRSDLVRTAVAWVFCRGNLKKAAEVLFVHENTVRYRINKIHDRLWPEENELSFYEQLAAAVRVYLLKHPGYRIAD